MGRSTVKKLLRPLLPAHLELELEPGLSMVLDLDKTNHEFLFWFHEEHESSLQWAIQNLLPKGGTFVDCGANLGLMGLLAIRHRHANVVFIEPHPRLAQTIRKNLDLNGFASHARVVEGAASHQDGNATLYIDAVSDGGHSLSPNWHGNDQSPPIEVKTFRLDTLFRQLSLTNVDFLKIDAEGCDLQVLEGLGDLLSPQMLGLLYIEMGGDSKTIWQRLTNRGYRAFAAETIYIDRLRQLQRGGDTRPYFSPATQADDGNLLWCAEGSVHEKFLLQTVSAGF